MQVSIGFSGPAGAGVFTAGIVLGHILAKKGYHVVGDREYESIIKGGNNLMVLYISDEKNNLSEKIDYFFAYDTYAVEKNETVYDLGKVYEVKKADCNYQNTCSLAMAAKLLGLDLKELEDEFAAKFSGPVLEKNMEDLKKGYALIEASVTEVKDLGKPRLFWHGNESIGKGAIKSGLGWYSAYPMTPASSLIEVITADHDVTFFQGEDEIAVSMSMLGAHFAGKRAMCGTSGGGFALMTESISYANQAELGGVYILAQRAGPSTGTPTFTEQGDLDFALHASFGDTYPIVVAPYDIEGAYNLIGKALNRSDQYQHPVVYLTDKMLAETFYAVDETELKTEEIDRGKLVEGELAEDFARYAVTEDGVSPYSVPGTANGTFIASSYEHDIYGATSEETLNKKIMTKKRHDKMKTFVNNVFDEKFAGYEIINPHAKKIFITFGFNANVLKEFVAEHTDRGLIIVTVVQPLNPRLAELLEAKFEAIDELVFVEQNYSGQFEKHIVAKCGLGTPDWNTKIRHLRKYDGYPIFLEDVVSFTS